MVLVKLMKKNLRIFFAVLAGAALLTLLAYGVSDHLYPERYIACEDNTLTLKLSVMEHSGEVDEEEITLTRGTPVRVRRQGQTESLVEYEGRGFEVPNSELADSLEECVQADAVYPRRTLTLFASKSGQLSDVTAARGQRLDVVQADTADLDQKTGMVNWYEVSFDQGTYYVPGKYVELSEEKALKNNASAAYSTYWDAAYGDGYSKDAFLVQEDWKESPVPDFESNPRRDDVKGIHVQMENFVSDPDYYMDLLDTTSLNALVLELKDESGHVMYDSNAVRAFLPDASQAIVSDLSMEELKSLIKKFQDKGYYMIGRISCFKDNVFASQFPDASMQNLDGSLYYSGNCGWASPYSRKAWQYNGDIAAEAAGMFNEVQLDYMRFPEGLALMQGQYKDHNEAKESKASAIQGFVSYVRDRVHEKDAYLSADVFGQVVTANDDQDMGQFVPGLLMAADYVCPMAYADHFSAGSLGIEYPWLEQGRLMEYYTHAASSIFANWPQYRPWFQGYANTPQDIRDQVNALESQGVKTWLIWDGAGSKENTEAVRPGIALTETGE